MFPTNYSISHVRGSLEAHAREAVERGRAVSSVREEGATRGGFLVRLDAVFKVAPAELLLVDEGAHPQLARVQPQTVHRLVAISWGNVYTSCSS